MKQRLYCRDVYKSERSMCVEICTKPGDFVVKYYDFNALIFKYHINNIKLNKIF